MVYKIISERNKPFFESLIFTILILFIGFFIGFFLESYRTGKVIDSYKNFEITALDLKLQNYYYQIMDSASCDVAIEQNFIFADDIYEEGLLLEKYEEANELSEKILLEKKKYVLLKTELWLNSILLREKCNKPFDILIYIYAQDRDTIKEAEQTAISKTLKELKQEKNNEVILIPIAGDLNLDIVDMQLRLYNISYFPSIIINDKVLEGFHSLGDIEKYLN